MRHGGPVSPLTLSLGQCIAQGPGTTPEGRDSEPVGAERWELSPVRLVMSSSSSKRWEMDPQGPMSKLLTSSVLIQKYPPPCRPRLA